MTQAGRVLLEHALQLDEMVRRTRHDIDRLSGRVTGEVRIGTVNSVGMYLLPSVLAKMRARYPETRPTVLYRTYQEIMEAFLSNKVDMAIVANPTSDRRLKQETVLVDKVSLVCGRTHPFFGRTQVTPEDLKGVNIVSLTDESPTGQQVRDYLDHIGVAEDPVVSTDNVETVKRMVQAGLGVALLPNMVTSESVACDLRLAGKLARIEVPPPALERKIVLVTWKRRELSLAATAFTDLLREDCVNWVDCRESPRTKPKAVKTASQKATEKHDKAAKTASQKATAKHDEAWIEKRIVELTGRKLHDRPRILMDRTAYMSIDRDNVVALDDRLFLILANEREGRFGLHDQPKFWVKRALDLETGQKVILKLVFHEDFLVQIGSLKIRCSRSAEKEARALEVARGDPRLMQGTTGRDTPGNLVRIIDFIRGEDLLTHLYGIEKPHEAYFHAELGDLMGRLITSLPAIQKLHDAGTCHGDIRNDHLIVERSTGRLRWIDFDLTQDFSDFDVWSVGNVLQVVIGKGLVTFRESLREQPHLVGELTEADASVFFPHRVMNLRKVFPYVPDKLNDILLRFSTGSNVFYETISQVVEDLGGVATQLGWTIDGSDAVVESAGQSKGSG
jgi:DNA-binding transcriptional LysR family regulator